MVREGLKVKYAEAKAAWELANKDLIDQYKEAQYQEVEREDKVRRLAVEVGGTQPFSGVVNKIFTSIIYDTDLALEWAIEHKLALELDQSAFDTFMRATVKKPDFVTFNEVAKATISRDLEKVLAEWPEEVEGVAEG